HDHGAGGLHRYVAVAAEGDADRRGHQGGRIVDAVTDEKSVGPRGLVTNNPDLLLRALAVEDVADSHLVGEEARLGLAITGYEQYAIDAMLGSKMLNKRFAFPARCVAKPER